MDFVKAKLKDASSVQSALIAAGILDQRVRVEKDKTHIYFPVKAKLNGYTVVEREGDLFERPKDLNESLKDLLSDKERELLIAGHDILGNVAIVDIPNELVAKESLIASAVLQAHKHVKTVLKKAHKHGGEFRTQQLTYLAGEETKEALVIESGTKILVDVEKVYFSVRLSTERMRIAQCITPGESVLVMFSGAGPYVVILAKHSVAATIDGVEKNPDGHKYAIENLRLNKIKHARVFEADCADLSFLEQRYDRIIMPLPASSEDFLESALSVAKDKAIIHIYIFGKDEDKLIIEGRLKDKLASLGWSCYTKAIVKAGHHAPHVYRWCFDLEVEKINH